jgi:hypothetical protein
VVPLIGPARAAHRSFRNVGRAFETPLTLLGGDAGHVPQSRPAALPRFGDLLERFETSRRLPLELGTPTT